MCLEKLKKKLPLVKKVGLLLEIKIDCIQK